ncbi:M1 family metallopeptidase [Persicobacter psychrovividus]|uniref:Aminopeptidase N n=1 Tax=Persicobacter psychrovividus TaxID=387638 RepID=A0ABN6L862_9BACT|nr:peptidase [Persicobacter psychrovividus]
MSKNILTVFMLIFFVGASHRTWAQTDIDVLHYRFDILVNSINDSIQGTAQVHFLARENKSNFTLDLVGQSEDGGMLVDQVSAGGRQVDFSQDLDQLMIESAISKGDTATVTIKYAGVPKDGLIISQNRHGHKTFFGDNWPVRAKNYLPVMDRPDDKASVDWYITAPEYMSVVANGKLVSSQWHGGMYKDWHYREATPIPTKVMVFGAAKLASWEIDGQGIPMKGFAYAEDSAKMHGALRVTNKVMDFFSEYIGPYPFEALWQVQSTTRYGGMENAGNIFYDENAVDDPKKMETLVAHEIAHQWFGNTVTEASWNDLWLSEGFATYFTAMYLEHEYGTAALNEYMGQARERLLAFKAKFPSKVVRPGGNPDPSKLLNAYSYQKGAWVLHMLRQEIGDAAFHAGIQKYYNTYKGKNASTADFERVMQSTTKRNLKGFFQHWLETPLLPRLSYTVAYDKEHKETIVTVKQHQDKLVKIKIEFMAITFEGDKIYFSRDLDQLEQTFRLQTGEQVNAIKLDPNDQILFLVGDN